MSMYGAFGKMDESFSSMFRGRDASLFGIDFDPAKGKTRQEFKDESDINVLMKRFKVTGLPPVAGQPKYLDCIDIPDFQNAMHILIDAEAAFARLPAVVRREFDNDARQFVEYAMEPDNLPRLREWGLAPPEKAPDAPMRVEVVNPAPPPGDPA